MPSLSASEYTQYLKFKASAGSTIRPAIQTRDNVSLSQSVINANLLASQAAFVTTPATTVVTENVAGVTNASTTTVTAARTDILSGATANGTVITYTSLTAYPHGLTSGQTYTVSGFGGNLLPTPNREGVVTVTSPTTFTIPATGTVSGTATGAGSINGRVYYTTGTVPHGLAVSDVISITGITTFTASNATVLSVDAATFTFALSSATTGTAVSGATGSITGLVYYTTNTTHSILAGTPFVSITGLTGTPAYNLRLATIYRVPTGNTFILQSSATGTAVTGGSGVLSVTTYPNRTMAVTGLARVQARPVVQFRSNPDARSTVSYAGTSGAIGSSRFQRPGGLPTGFKSSTSTYTRLPQQAGW
jgi:hypothetical protein